MSLSEGQKAPDFSLPDENGNTVSLAKLKGQKVVLFFYPKANTPGCTQESCDFSDRFEKFKKANTVVLGISKDSVEKQAKFKDKYDMGITLLSDADGTTCEDYGVWKQKSMFGKKYMGIERATFFIDEDGIIKKTWPKVKVAGHADDVYEAITA